MGFILKSMNFRKAAEQIITLGMIVSSALIIWKFLMVVTGSESPIVVDLSESMTPAFQRGDILFLRMGEDPIRAGEIVVFKIDRREIPVIHRVIKVHQRNDTKDVDVLTKGDSNDQDDRVLYEPGKQWLEHPHIMGRAVGSLNYFSCGSDCSSDCLRFLPYVGYVTIIMTDYPFIKYALIGPLGLLAITSKD